MAWIFYALASAVLWGASYALYEQLLKTISAATAMFFTAFVSIFCYGGWALYNGYFTKDWEVLKSGGNALKLILIIAVINAAANLLGFVSMKAKSATAFSLIEISYPIFVALFAWLFFKEVQLSLGLVLGGFLITSGVLCIMFFNKTI